MIVEKKRFFFWFRFIKGISGYGVAVSHFLPLFIIQKFPSISHFYL